MERDLLIFLAVAVASVVSTIIGHLIGRRKYAGEAAASFAEADAKHTEAQGNVIDMLSEQIERLQTHCGVMDKKIIQLQNENRDLRRSVSELAEQRKSYQSRIAEYEKNQDEQNKLISNLHLDKTGS